MKNIEKVKKITVIGGGVSGVALAVLAHSAKFEVFLSDNGNINAENTKMLNDNDITYESGGHSDRLYDADLLVLSSGISPNAPCVLSAQNKKIPIKGELDFVFDFIKRGNVPKIIGVTGSNGKTTTTSLLGHLLNNCGKNAVAAGNIGTPLASCAGGMHEIIAAELSSFQLHWAYDIAVDGAIITNFAPDHIDWHGSYEAYIAAKIKLVQSIKNGGFLICQGRDMDLFKIFKNAENIYPLFWARRGDGRCTRLCVQGIFLDEKEKKCFIIKNNKEINLFNFEDTLLLGKHNMENAAMASCACYLLTEGERDAIDGIKRGLKTFEAPPHRCSFVCEIDGVKFVDDSKGTNVAASVTAITSLEGKKIVLLGGKGKGENYEPLAGALKNNGRYAVLYDSEAQNIAAALKSAGYEDFCFAEGLENAVREAFKRALSGDVVLLSPACTSWDKYNNYKERGAHFRSVAQSLGIKK